MGGVIIVFSCWVSITAFVLGLEAFHWPVWLAIVIGIPLGFVLGFPLAAILYLLPAKSVQLLSRGKIVIPDMEGVNLLDGVIVPTLGMVVLTLLLVPVYNKIKHNAELKRHQAALGQPFHRVQPTR